MHLHMRFRRLDSVCMVVFRETNCNATKSYTIFYSIYNSTDFVENQTRYFKMVLFLRYWKKTTRLLRFFEASKIVYEF
jgi:hypothetical protein